MKKLPSDLQVGLFYTCLVDSIKPNVARAAVCLIEAAGYKVEIPPDQTCCGRPAFNSGNRKLTRKIARQVIEQFEPFDYVVGPSGSCLSMLVKHYPDLLKEDPIWFSRARNLASKSHELMDFLVNVADFTGLDRAYSGSVTFHDSCSGLRELGIKSEPRKLLSLVPGLEIREMDASEDCCGFGGTFSVKYPELSTRMVDRKIDSILRTGADTVTGIDMGCLMNIFGRLNRLGSDIKVFHAAEILAGLTDDGPLGSSPKKNDT